VPEGLGQGPKESQGPRGAETLPCRFCWAAFRRPARLLCDCPPGADPAVGVPPPAAAPVPGPSTSGSRRKSRAGSRRHGTGRANASAARTASHRSRADLRRWGRSTPGSGTGRPGRSGSLHHPFAGAASLPPCRTVRTSPSGGKGYADSSRFERGEDKIPSGRKRRTARRPGQGRPRGGPAAGRNSRERSKTSDGLQLVP
jgi:hypothetical protein